VDRRGTATVKTHEQQLTWMVNNFYCTKGLTSSTRAGAHAFLIWTAAVARCDRTESRHTTSTVRTSQPHLDFSVPSFSSFVAVVSSVADCFCRALLRTQHTYVHINTTARERTRSNSATAHRHPLLQSAICVCCCTAHIKSTPRTNADARAQSRRRHRRQRRGLRIFGRRGRC
jgi:hypothetical protein